MRSKEASKIQMNVGYLPTYLCLVNSSCYIDMIIDNDPPIERHISVPRDFSQLSCSSFTAGIVEAVLDGLCFVSTTVAITNGL